MMKKYLILFIILFQMDVYSQDEADFEEEEEFIEEESFAETDEDFMDLEEDGTRIGEYGPIPEVEYPSIIDGEGTVYPLIGAEREGTFENIDDL